MENWGETCSYFYSVPCEDIIGFPQNLLILQSQIWKSLAASQLNFAVQSCRCTGTGKPRFGKKVPKIDIDLFNKKAILKKSQLTSYFLFGADAAMHSTAFSMLSLQR